MWYGYSCSHAFIFGDPNGKPSPRGGILMPSLWQVVIKGCCPRCGDSPLFVGWYRRVNECAACKLRYEGEDSADGPAYIAIVVTGLIVTFLAMFVEFFFRPSYWIHAALWLPLILLMSLGILRLAKAFFIALEYRNHIGVYQHEREDWHGES